MKRWRLLVLLLAAGGIGLNGIACMQARAMTHYAPGGERTPRPTQLNRWDKLKVLLTGVTLPRPELDRFPSDAGVVFETLQVPAGPDAWIEAWRIASAGPENTINPPRGIVLMFPGYGSSKQALIDDAARFSAMGFEVWPVDFRGSGGSSGAVTTIGVRESEDVALLGEYVQRERPGLPMVAYGRSMGSAAILRATARLGFKPDAMILECPFDTLMNTVNNRFDLMGVPAFPLAPLLVFWGGVQNGNWAFGNRPMDFATAVQCPALVMNGARDRNARPEDVSRVFESISGPRRQQVFEDCGHRAMSRCDPELWTDTVESFLREHALLPK